MRTKKTPEEITEARRRAAAKRWNKNQSNTAAPSEAEKLCKELAELVNVEDCEGMTESVTNAVNAALFYIIDARKEIAAALDEIRKTAAEIRAALAEIRARESMPAADERASTTISEQKPRKVAYFAPAYNVEEAPAEKEKDGFAILWKINFRKTGKYDFVPMSEARKAAQFVNELQRFPELLKDPVFPFSAYNYRRFTRRANDAKVQVLEIVSKAENICPLIAFLEEHRENAQTWDELVKLFYNYK